MTGEKEMTATQKRMLYMAMACLKKPKLGQELVDQLKVEMDSEDVAFVEKNIK